MARFADGRVVDEGTRISVWWVGNTRVRPVQGVVGRHWVLCGNRAFPTRYCWWSRDDAWVAFVRQQPLCSESVGVLKRGYQELYGVVLTDEETRTIWENVVLNA